jgi:FkbM family methyltransferase
MDYGCKELSRVKLNHPEKLNFFQIALSDKDESKEISYSKGLGELATLVESNMELNFVSNQNTEKMLIQASRLDSIQQVYPELFPRVDFIKIDVEGHEYAVITGANETISKFKPKLIQIEFNIYNLFAEISLLKIAKLQIEAEDEYEKSADKILICDTNLTVIKIWSMVKYGRCDSWIIEQDQQRHYDFTLLMNVDLPWVDDPLREHPNPSMRNHLMNLYLNEIKLKKTPFDVVSGSGEDRIHCALQILSSNNFLIPSLDIK